MLWGVVFISYLLALSLLATLKGTRVSAAAACTGLKSDGLELKKKETP